MDVTGSELPPQQPQSQILPDPPRLKDFKLLRLPLIELIVVALLGCFAFIDINYMTGANGLITMVLVVPLLVIMAIAFAVTFPLISRPVDEFIWDLRFLLLGALGLVSMFAGTPYLLWLIGFLPSAVSLLLRRLTALLQWRNGYDPRVPAQPK